MGQVTDIVDPVECDTAVDLLSALLGPESQYFKGQPYSWIFRGVDRTEYELIPSALRDDAFSMFDFNTQEWQQIRHEWLVIKSFYELANLRGMQLPDDSQRIHELVQTYDPEVTNEECEEKRVWPPSELLPLSGLAQHHGIPTRLLDWTYDPRVAAYFAARNVVKYRYEIAPSMKNAVRSYLSRTGDCVDEEKLNEEFEPSGNKIAVWALFKPFHDSLRQLKESRPNAKPIPYEILSIPNATNPNIQAQQGVFTLVRHRGSTKTTDRSSFERILSHYLNCYFPELLPPNETPIPVFVKFELPWKECEGVLRLLANLGVNASTVFPGYRGVANAVWEELRWWKAPLRSAPTRY